jgi:hypothetical protein
MDYANPLRIGPSARDCYLEMMKSVVRPELRSLGFRSRGTGFSLPSATHFATIGIQQSSSNTWVRTQFTGNVNVIARDEWTEDKAPDPNLLWGRGFSDRLGNLSAYREDHWWSVWASIPTAGVASDLLTAIRDHALPTMRERLS